ncbi:MAG: acetyl-coenzyme A synthetase N-terminal domain-containing protein, partial [Panacagrimonas sp.]
MLEEGELLWTPRPEFAEQSEIAKFMRWLAQERALNFADYEALRQWSVSDIEAFWAAIWDYFKIDSDTAPTQVLDTRAMPGAKWFVGSRVNYAEHLLRYEAQAEAGEIAIHHLAENRPLASMSWQELGGSVRKLATRLRDLGIQPGDRIVSYMPNVPETTIAMIASIAVGAVWSSAAPEFGTKTVIERFAQIEPKL